MDEKTLTAYVSIAAAIATHARMKAEDDYISYGKDYPNLQSNEILYYNNFVSTYESVSETLNGLGITRELSLCYLIFNQGPDEDACLAKANWRSGPCFPDLLYTFIGLFGEYGADFWGFGTKTDTFFEPKSPQLRSALMDLIGLGYAEEINGSFRWTDQIRHVMEDLGFWPTPS